MVGTTLLNSMDNSMAAYKTQRMVLVGMLS